MTHNEGWYKLELSVRDYEVDMEGVVNNAVYQNYLEHARHEYLKSIGINFAAMVEQGINMVLTRIELDYKWPLTSGDSFVIELKPFKISPVRVGFIPEHLPPAGPQGDCQGHCHRNRPEQKRSPYSAQGTASYSEYLEQVTWLLTAFSADGRPAAASADAHVQWTALFLPVPH